MEEFEISGNGDFIRIIFDKVHGFPNKPGYWGGYDLDCSLMIEVGNFKVTSTFYSSTGEFYNFYKSLSKSNDLLKGDVYYANYENDLEFKITYDQNGQVNIVGSFQKFNGINGSKLSFEYTSDQSYVQATLKQLGTIISKYSNDVSLK